MSTGYVIPLDPSELASRFSSRSQYEEDEAPYGEGADEGDEEDERGSEYDISIEEFASYFADCEDFESKIEPLLERIPEREADLILMYFVHEKRQLEIASIFGVTQAAISYRLDRGIKRIKFLLSIPQVTKEDLLTDLQKVFPPAKDGSSIDVDILVGMWETTCQSEVATRLNLTQGRVRHRFFKAVKALEEIAERDSIFSRYFQIFSAIAGKNFNILREVKLPQWSNRGGDSCF